MAAGNHERAAKFWEGQGDSERAALQREMAEHERRGAELERRWADLSGSDTARGKVRAAEDVVAQTQQSGKTASSILVQLANTLERAAVLAEEHAQRHERAGRLDDASTERQTAQNAREAAQRARSQAEQWLAHAGG
jgi:hypothetical protein